MAGAIMGLVLSGCTGIATGNEYTADDIFNIFGSILEAQH